MLLVLSVLVNISLANPDLSCDSPETMDLLRRSWDDMAVHGADSSNLVGSEIRLWNARADRLPGHCLVDFLAIKPDARLGGSLPFQFANSKSGKVRLIARGKPTLNLFQASPSGRATPSESGR